MFPQQQQPVTPPVVIINQSYRPETANPAVRDYSDADLPPAVRSYDAPVRPMPEPSDLPARKRRGPGDPSKGLPGVLYRGSVHRLGRGANRGFGEDQRLRCSRAE